MKQDINDQIKIMEAFRDGKAIQLRTHTGPRRFWHGEAREFNFAYFEYRIKPGPRTFYILSAPGIKSEVFSTLSAAREHARRYIGTTIYKVEGEEATPQPGRKIAELPRFPDLVGGAW